MLNITLCPRIKRMECSIRSNGMTFAIALIKLVFCRRQLLFKIHNLLYLNQEPSVYFGQLENFFNREASPQHVADEKDSPGVRDEASSTCNGQTFFRAVNFRAELFLLPLVMGNLLLRVEVELFGNLAADGPDFLQRFVTFRFHNLSPAIPAVSPATACAVRAAHSRAGCVRSCSRWPDACNSMSPAYHNCKKRRAPDGRRRQWPRRA